MLGGWRGQWVGVGWVEGGREKVLGGWKEAGSRYWMGGGRQWVGVGWVEGGRG